MKKYTNEKNAQILIAILKANGIKKVVVSPGATNISIVYSMMNDGSFEMYSAVDERGAAYIACGLSSESGEPVVITCTGATASRNYFPGLTEAYHRKLPILAITASQDFAREGNLSPQFIDRTEHPKDSLRESVQIPIIRSKDEEYECALKINKAVLELFRHGGGPVHINIASEYSNDFSVLELPMVPIIRRIGFEDDFPSIAKKERIAIVVGTHKKWEQELIDLVDEFCAIYNAVVLVDHSSHYWGKYRILSTIITSQEQHKTELFDIDLLIHIGEEHGDYYTDAALIMGVKEVWRVSEDGEIRDAYRKLTNTFEMSEKAFFKHYVGEYKEDVCNRHEYFDEIKAEAQKIYNAIPELPFSNIWLAQQIIPRFPIGACLELGVSNTMRAWTFFDFPQETYVLANTGCRGIDGAIPTVLGMALANPSKLHYAVMGDLTFFYSFNVLGNRHIGNNIRILLVNNGTGCEFHNYQHRAYQIYEGNHEELDKYTAAGKQTGSRSKELVRHYAEDLGFRYLTASDKEEFCANLPEFLDNKMDKSIIFEVFTDEIDESNALKMVRNAEIDLSKKVKNKIKKVLGRE